MVRGLFLFPMDPFIRENFKTTCPTVREFGTIPMEPNTMGNMKRESKMEREPTFFLTGVNLQELLPMDLPQVAEPTPSTTVRNTLENLS